MAGPIPLVGTLFKQKLPAFARDSKEEGPCGRVQHALLYLPEFDLKQVQKRVLDSTTGPFLFRVTSEGRQFLLEEGTDQRYGARHLKRAIERYIVCPIARLVATAQVRQGDALVIDRQRGDKGLAFSRDTERRLSNPSAILASRN